MNFKKSFCSISLFSWYIISWSHFLNKSCNLFLKIRVNFTNTLNYFLNFKRNLQSRKIFYFNFRYNSNITSNQHILKLLFDQTLKKNHINFHTMTIRNNFIHLFYPIINHILKRYLFISTHQIFRLYITINQYTSHTIILLFYSFRSKSFLYQYYRL